MDNVEIIRLCTDYCYCIKIGSDIGPPAVLHPIPILVKITISMANILADPIIGTPIVLTAIEHSNTMYIAP